MYQLQDVANGLTFRELLLFCYFSRRISLNLDAVHRLSNEYEASHRDIKGVGITLNHFPAT